MTGVHRGLLGGEDISQRRQPKGNRPLFEAELKKIGLDAEAIEDYVSALEEGGLDGKKSQTFLDRVKSGTVALTSNASAGVVAGTLVELGKLFLAG